MKYSFIALLLSITYFSSCKSGESPADDIKPRTAVTITQIANGSMVRTIKLSAISKYIQHSAVTASVAGYIHLVKINFNDRVVKGQLLYTLETKERKALGNLNVNDSTGNHYGLIDVYAPVSGVITSLQQQSGIFVTEGSSLCNIVGDNSMYFLINIPYEYIKHVKENPLCNIILPDGTNIEARIQQPLPQADSSLQAIAYMAKPIDNFFVPENIIASARLIVYEKPNTQILPKSAVLSDELMQNFWVMKLINDSVAIKVPVTIGEQNDSLTEIKIPVFDKQDKILNTGNYGLPDTALVKVF